MNNYQVIFHCLGNSVITVKVRAWTMNKAQEIAELLVKRAFTRITVSKMANK